MKMPKDKRDQKDPRDARDQKDSTKMKAKAELSAGAIKLIRKAKLALEQGCPAIGWADLRLAKGIVAELERMARSECVARYGEGMCNKHVLFRAA